MRVFVIITLLLIITFGCTTNNYYDIKKEYYNSEYYSSIGLENLIQQRIKYSDIYKVKVGIIDSGFTANKSLINSVLLNSKSGNKISNISYENHGDIVSGIIGSKKIKKNNFQGFLPEINLYLYNISNSMTEEKMIEAIEEMISQKMDVINICLTTSKYNERLYIAIKNAVDSGATIIASSGNSGDKTNLYPAAFDIEGVLSVSATDLLFNVYKNSTNNKYVDIWAPGEHIYSNNGKNPNEIKKYDGTSVATPIVTSLVVLIKAKFPRLTPPEIESLIKKGAYRYQAKWGTQNVNISLINFYNSLELATHYYKQR
ncbi:S8 family serine peptidase [Paenibacillus thiaminolyticus]|uniref:S8 family peptidase n=1 Tax=Paenibacillus thiaminolyticus TaxID=49283 RepID=UPI003D2C1875